MPQNPAQQKTVFGTTIAYPVFVACQFSLLVQCTKRPNFYIPVTTNLFTLSGTVFNVNNAVQWFYSEHEICEHIYSFQCPI